MHSKTEEICKLAIANEASDVHLQMGQVPKMRVHGTLMDVGSFRVVDDPELILSLLSEKQKSVLRWRKKWIYR